MPWSSNGLSAVRSRSGTPASLASITAGKRLAVAVPLLVTTTAGLFVAMPYPSAWKPALLSSIQETKVTWWFSPTASASGDDLEPGLMT